MIYNHKCQWIWWLDLSKTSIYVYFIQFYKSKFTFLGYFLFLLKSLPPINCPHFRESHASRGIYYEQYSMLYSLSKVPRLLAIKVLRFYRFKAQEHFHCLKQAVLLRFWCRFLPLNVHSYYTIFALRRMALPK